MHTEHTQTYAQTHTNTHTKSLTLKNRYTHMHIWIAINIQKHTCKDRHTQTQMESYHTRGTGTYTHRQTQTHRRKASCPLNKGPQIPTQRHKTQLSGQVVVARREEGEANLLIINTSPTSALPRLFLPSQPCPSIFLFSCSVFLAHFTVFVKCLQYFLISQILLAVFSYDLPIFPSPHISIIFCLFFFPVH